MLREKIAEGYVGQIRQIHLDICFPRWPRDWQQNPWIGKREQGGAIREVSPHLFHALMQIFGPIDRVQAHTQGTLALRSWSKPYGTQEPGGELQPLDFPPADSGMMENLARAIRGELADLARFEHGLRIQQVLDAWERAAASGCWQEVEG